MLGPVGEHVLQHAGRGRLADRDRSGQADHERGARQGASVQEVLLGAVQGRRPLDVEREQPRERGQVDLFDLVEVQLVAQTAQFADLLGAQRIVGLLGERGPRRSIQLDVRRGLAVGVMLSPVVRHGGDSCSSPALRREEASRSVDSGLMCGIVGYVGEKSAQDVVIEGLRRLEYRGYDSAGIALVVDGELY